MIFIVRIISDIRAVLRFCGQNAVSGREDKASNYTYGGDKTGVTASIDLTSVKNHTVYKADPRTGTGTGKVLWAPTLQGEGEAAHVVGGTLTLDNAYFLAEKSNISVFKLPKDATIELLGRMVSVHTTRSFQNTPFLK